MAALPSLGSLRVAAPADVLRIGIVATAGFKYSPLFRWERPHHEQYPGDTLLSYCTQFQNAIQSEDFQEDAYDANENEKTEAVIPGNNGWEPPKAGSNVVVGVISVKLDPDSTRRGQLKNRNGECGPYIGSNLNLHMANLASVSVSRLLSGPSREPRPRLESPALRLVGRTGRRC
jgi:hypothetical protein